MALTYNQFSTTPTGYVPGQDKMYLISFAQLPDAASLDRTEKVIRDMSSIALDHPAVESAVAFPGLSINGFTNSPNSGIVFAHTETILKNVPHLRCLQVPLQAN